MSHNVAKHCMRLPDPGESEASAASTSVLNSVLNCVQLLLFLHLCFDLSACWRHFLLFLSTHNAVPRYDQLKKKSADWGFFKMDVRVCKNLYDLAAFAGLDTVAATGNASAANTHRHTFTSGQSEPIFLWASIQKWMEVNHFSPPSASWELAGRSSPPLPLNHSGAGSALGPHHGKPASPNLSLHSDTRARSCWILI